LKYILQVGLETDLVLFSLMDKIKDIFSQDVENENFKDTTRFKLIEYRKIKDCFTYLEGVDNRSGKSDWLDKQWVLEHKK
jgi:hypothetical protein